MKNPDVVRINLASVGQEINEIWWCIDKTWQLLNPWFYLFVALIILSCVSSLCTARCPCAWTVIVEVKREKLCLSGASQISCSDFCLGPALWHSLLALGCGWEALVALVRMKFQADVTKSSSPGFHTLTSSFQGSFNPANTLYLKLSAFTFPKFSFKSW